MKLAFIGAGKHARANLYPSLAQLGVSVDAIVTRSVETAEAGCAQLGGGNAFDSIDTMLNEIQPDAVLVSAGPRDQFSIAMKLVEAGCHVFVEKPLGWNASEAKFILEASAKRDRCVAVGFMKRHAPAYKRLRDFCTSAENGQLSSVNGMFAIRSFGNDPEPFLRLGAIHYVDLVTFLLGDVNQIDGVIKTLPKGVHFNIQGISSAGVLFQISLVGLPSWARHHEELTAHREGGFARVVNVREYIEHHDQKVELADPAWQHISESDIHSTSIDTSSAGGAQALYLNGYVGEIRAFLAAAGSDERYSGDAVDNLRTTELCDKILSLKRI